MPSGGVGNAVAAVNSLRRGVGALGDSSDSDEEVNSENSEEISSLDTSEEERDNVVDDENDLDADEKIEPDDGSDKDVPEIQRDDSSLSNDG